MRSDELAYHQPETASLKAKIEMTPDLTTAAGYQAWRDAGGLWPDETPERVAAWKRAHAEALAVEVDLDDCEPLRGDAVVLLRGAFVPHAEAARETMALMKAMSERRGAA